MASESHGQTARRLHVSYFTAEKCRRQGSRHKSCSLFASCFAQTRLLPTAKRKRQTLARPRARPDLNQVLRGRAQRGPGRGRSRERPVGRSARSVTVSVVARRVGAMDWLHRTFSAGLHLIAALPFLHKFAFSPKRLLARNDSRLTDALRSSRSQVRIACLRPDFLRSSPSSSRGTLAAG